MSLRVFSPAGARALSSRVGDFVRAIGRFPLARLRAPRSGGLLCGTRLFSSAIAGIAEPREANQHHRPDRGFWVVDASEQLGDVDAAVHDIGSERELFEIKREGVGCYARALA
jgi:hypothetical protein